MSRHQAARLHLQATAAVAHCERIAMATMIAETLRPTTVLQITRGCGYHLNNSNWQCCPNSINLHCAMWRVKSHPVRVFSIRFFVGIQKPKMVGIEKFSHESSDRYQQSNKYRKNDP